MRIKRNTYWPLETEGKICEHHRGVPRLCAATCSVRGDQATDRRSHCIYRKKVPGSRGWVRTTEGCGVGDAAGAGSGAVLDPKVWSSVGIVEWLTSPLPNSVLSGAQHLPTKSSGHRDTLLMGVYFTTERVASAAPMVNRQTSRHRGVSFVAFTIIVFVAIFTPRQYSRSHTITVIKTTLKLPTLKRRRLAALLSHCHRLYFGDLSLLQS